MKIERARLKRMCTLVNAAATASVFLTLAACGDGSKKSETVTQISEPFELNAIWNSGPLPRETVAFAMSEGAIGVMAIAYKGAGLQILDLEGAPLGQEADLKVASLARGQAVFFGETGLVLFPGLGSDGAAQLYATGEGLIAPIALDIDLGNAGAIEGICSGSAGGAPGSVMQIAYWTSSTPYSLIWGDVIADAEGNLSFEPNDSVTARNDISACTFDAGGPVIAVGPRVLPVRDVALTSEQLEGRFSASAPIRELDHLTRDDGKNYYVGRISTGFVFLVDTETGAGNILLVRPGLSVEVPDAPSGLAALGSPRGGGYPYGVIALTGLTEAGDNRIVFVDTGPLFVASVD